MRHVAILIETSGSYGRGLLRGVARYNREHGGWSTYFQPHGLGDQPPPWLRRWMGDGILARIDNRKVADFIRRLRIPAVNLRGTIANLRFPYVGIDHSHVARLAAGHLLERGLRNFGFVGRPRGVHPGLDQRGEMFRLIVRRAGGTCAMFDSQAGRDWERDQDQLAGWIDSLPKPIGILAANDERGLQVLDACRRCGAAVPDDVAVIGVDNDELLCELSIPPLTSVDVNPEQIGYTAARLLDGLMRRGKTPARTSPIAPRGVVVRRSTDIVASDDPDLNTALRFIREHACEGISVIDVLRQVQMSRVSLQQRMKQVLRRTIHQQIERVRLQRAKEMLLMPGLSIKQVARQTGFGTAQYLTRVFRQRTGETPAAYRTSRIR